MTQIDYSNKQTLNQLWERIKERGDGRGDSYTKAEIDALLASKFFVATYNVTTAQELMSYLDSVKEPFAPVIVKRGNDYYTAALATKSGDDKVIVRVMGSGSGDYIVFNYTITGNVWGSSSYIFQQKLTSGTNIKTVNSQSLLGSGDIDTRPDWSDVQNKPTGLVVDANYIHTDSNYTAAEKSKLAGLAGVKSIGVGLALSGEGELSAIGEGGTADSVAWANVTGKPDFAAVATSGSYNDLEDKPVIPAAYDDTALAGRITAVEGKQDLCEWKTNGNWMYRITGDFLEAIYTAINQTIAITNSSGAFYRSNVQTVTVPAEVRDNKTLTVKNVNIQCGHSGYPNVGTLETIIAFPFSF